jgi:hypothetical protein
MPPQNQLGSISEAAAKLQHSLQPSVRDAIAELDRSMRPFREAMEEHLSQIDSLPSVRIMREYECMTRPLLPELASVRMMREYERMTRPLLPVSLFDHY